MVLHLLAQVLGEGDEHLPTLSSGVQLTLPYQQLKCCRLCDWPLRVAVESSVYKQ